MITLLGKVNSIACNFNSQSILGDALVVDYALAKNDQEGEMTYPRHIYANPSIPVICPILR